MTKAEQFEALALRCEQATGADRRLDVDIAIATGIIGETDPSSATEVRANEDDIGWVDYWRGGTLYTDRAASFSASLDAALTLVPEGMRPSVGQNVHHGYWHAFVQSIVDSTPHQLGVADSNTSGALALCAAALRAQGAVMPKNKTSYLDEIANEIVQAQEQQYIATGKNKFYSISLDYKKWHEIIVALRARAQMEMGE